ncbi:MAG: FecR domain-containing protein, partial [Polaromonas sp.]
MTRICRTLVGGTLALGFGLPATAEVLPGRAAAAKTAAAAVFAAAGRAQPAGESTASAASILAVEGKVRYRLAPDQAWQQAKAGVALGEGAEIETAIRSAVQIKVGSAQVLTIDRASRVAIKEAINRAGTDKTTVDLPYGRVKFEVNSATVANEVKIQAPDATLAVKGTIGYMEVTPGQPTLAYGGQNNTGTFNVTYAGSGTTHPVTEQQQTNATAPDPASNSLEQTHVDVGAPAARSGDETQQVTNSPGGGESLTLITGGGNQQINTPPRAAVGPTDIAFINFDGSAAVLKRRGALSGDTTDVLDGAAFTGSFNPASANAGLALAPDASGAGRDLLRLESDSGGWTLLGLGLQGGTAFDVRSMSSGQSSEFLFGLGSIGNRLFTGGRPSISAPDELSGIYEIMQGSSSVQRRMSLPMALGGDLAGSAERGTVWVYGQPGARDSFFASGTFFEVDPRSNAVLRVTAPLIAGPTTVYGDGVSPGMLISGPVRGLAFSADRIIAQVGGLFVVIDPTAQGTATSPTIVAVSLSAATLPGLASESLNRPPAPFNLAPSTGLIDPALQPLFAQMGYTAVAASSPFFRQMVAGEVIRTASDPQGCQGTISLAGLGSALAGHAGQAAGVGQGVNDYRMGLTIGHACLLPGQVPTLPVLLGVAAGGDLLGFDLNGVETPQLTGINPPLFGMGA